MPWVMFHQVLEAYPPHHLWITTTHISLGKLDRQLHMINRQKSLANQLLVKLQDPPPASQIVVNDLLDEFANIDNIMSPTSSP